MNSDEGFVITGKDNIEAYRRLALRHRLHLETIGLTFRGMAVSNAIRKMIDSKTRSRLKLLQEYEDWMEQQGLEFNRYTESVKLTQVQEEKHEIPNHIQRE
jgi:hypothetical protein